MKKLDIFIMKKTIKKSENYNYKAMGSG